MFYDNEIIYGKTEHEMIELIFNQTKKIKPYFFKVCDNK